MSSFEEILKTRAAQLDELQLATVLLQNKEALREQLLQAKLEVASMAKGIEIMRQDLETVKSGSAKCRMLSEMLKKLDAKIVSMDASLPDEFIQDFTKLSQAVSPYPTRSASSVANSDNSERADLSRVEGRINEMSLATPELKIENCKKTLFKKAEDSYSMDLLSEEEFSKIPKYMIGRQSLAALNDLVTSINQILEGKYRLLALGKNGARKKGKLDLYLSLKQNEIVVASGEDPIYFFTAEDYHRHTQSKLDKTKLNLLTALRHCKRIRELRAGKTLQYALVPTWESGRG